MKQEPRSAPRTADSVVRHFERLILEGSLRPGERLLAERELALRLQVSRPVLREGLQRLQASGLLTSTPGAGARVASLGTSITDPLGALLASAPLETTADYLSFRQICEGPAACMAAEHGTAVDHDQIRRCMDRINVAHEHDVADEEAEADADFHIAIYEATHNIVLLHVMRALSAMLRKGVFYSRARLYGRPEIRGLLRRQHQGIHDAIIGRSPEAARLATEHVGFVREALLEITRAEQRLSVSLRRIGEGGAGLARGTRPRRTPGG